MVTGDNEVYQGDESIQRLGRGEVVAEDTAGFLTKPIHSLAGILYATVIHSVIDKCGDFFRLKKLLAGQLHHPVMLLPLAGLKHMKERQGYLPLPQVIAGRLTDFSVREIIENVILDLETEAKQTGELPERVKPAGIGLPCGRRADLGTADKQRRGLPVNDAEICLLVEMVVAGIVYLVKLAD